MNPLHLTQHQLDCFTAVVKHNFHISRAAHVLCLSQPAVSRHIQALEEQIGLNLFLREGRSIRSLSPAGEELLEHAIALQENWELLRKRLRYLGQQTVPKMRLATTHTQAVYRLPEPLKQFRDLHPEVQLELHQAVPSECVQWVLDGKADIAIATEEIPDRDDLWIFPCYTWNRGFLVPKDHPLTRLPHVDLKDVAKYPILTYSFGFTGRSAMDTGFRRAGVQPQLALTAVDSEVIKTYVRAGFGVGIVARMIWSADKDPDLAMIDGSQSFPWSTVWIGLPKNRQITPSIKAFIRFFASAIPSQWLDNAFKGVSQDWNDLIEDLPKY